MATFAGIRTPSGAVRPPISEDLMLKKFQFTFSTPNLNNGVIIMNPAVGDELLDVWVEIDTAFNGTTPNADVGDFTGGTTGWFSDGTGAIDLTHADVPSSSGPLLLWAGSSGATSARSLANGSGSQDFRQVPGKLTTVAPIKLVVSQNGTKGGAATGATQGSGTVYILTATPQ